MHQPFINSHGSFLGGTIFSSKNLIKVSLSQNVQPDQLIQAMKDALDPPPPAPNPEVDHPTIGESANLALVKPKNIFKKKK